MLGKVEIWSYLFLLLPLAGQGAVIEVGEGGDTISAPT
jgi:hypothetical protein